MGSHEIPEPSNAAKPDMMSRHGWFTAGEYTMNGIATATSSALPLAKVVFDELPGKTATNIGILSAAAAATALAGVINCEVKRRGVIKDALYAPENFLPYYGIKPKKNNFLFGLQILQRRGRIKV